jgi:DNA-binding GntR family transcriptional regulator
MIKRSNHHSTLPKQTVVDEAYHRLKEMILNEHLPADYQALEQDIADLLGVSRTPVREVLTRLQDEELIERVPRHGFRVVPFGPNDARELYELLECLEGKAVELLVYRRLDPDSAEISKIKIANVDVESALSERDLNSWADADQRFHHGIIQACNNGRLQRMTYRLWEQVHRIDRGTMLDKPFPHYSAIDHIAILEAIETHDAIGARELMYQHRIRGMNILLESFANRKRIKF